MNHLTIFAITDDEPNDLQNDNNAVALLSLRAKRDPLELSDGNATESYTADQTRLSGKKSKLKTTQAAK